MLTIYKSEIKYFRILIGMIFSLLLLFLFFAVMNLKNLFEVEFFNRYIWSIYIGLGTYSLVFAIWLTRFKESRDCLHSQIPITKKLQSLSRWLFGISPFLIVWIILEIFRFVIPNEFNHHINGIVAQLSMLFIFIVTFDILHGYNNGFARNRLLIQVVVGSIIFILSSLVIYAVTVSIIPPFIFGGREFYFMAWGLLISLFDIHIFNNRELFIR